MTEIKYEGGLFNESGLSAKKVEGQSVAVLENINYFSDPLELAAVLNQIKDSGVEGIVVDFSEFPIKNGYDKDSFVQHYRTLIESGVNYKLLNIDKCGMCGFSTGFRDRISENSYESLDEALRNIS